tara:strand:+ start:580 stop:795 length:216 start_codon:yes stop_codon:yes gene_type:complete
MDPKFQPVIVIERGDERSRIIGWAEETEIEAFHARKGMREFYESRGYSIVEQFVHETPNPIPYVRQFMQAA